MTKRQQTKRDDADDRCRTKWQQTNIERRINEPTATGVWLFDVNNSSLKNSHTLTLRTSKERTCSFEKVEALIFSREELLSYCTKESNFPTPDS